MASKLDIFSSIRITKGRAKAATAAPQPQSRTCDHPECHNKGMYRAPKGRDRENEFFMFCEAHVREYNAKYNYFVGQSDDDVRAFQKDASLGHRPTWNMGVRRAKTGENIQDPFNVLGSAFKAARPKAHEDEAPGVGALSKKAFDVLGLKPNAKNEAIKARFKELAKLHHPDSNGGDRSSEERFSEIMQAYKQLKAAGFAK
jgi:curved DNA-binding protein CbpA